MSQHRIIKRRLPSPVSLRSRLSPDGVMLIGFRDPSLGFLNIQDDEFCPAKDLQEVFGGSVESWLDPNVETSLPYINTMVGLVLRYAGKRILILGLGGGAMSFLLHRET